MKETDILMSICDYLQFKTNKKELWFTRLSPIPVYSVNNQAFIRMPKYTRTGLPDILVIRDGFTIGLEVKKEKGKQSPNQKQLEKEWKENGAEYYIVKCIEDVQKIGL